MKLRITLLLVLSLTLFGSVVYADDCQVTDDILNEVIEDIDIVNEQIDNMVKEAIEEADRQKIKNANEPDEFEEELDILIEELIDEVNEIANEAIEEAASKGITVICELIEVEIQGRVILIDPLRVGAF